MSFVSKTTAVSAPTAHVVIALMLLCVTCVARADSPAAESPLASRCRALANEDFAETFGAPTQIVQAKPNPQNGQTPAFCEVTGYVAPSVGFKLQLPLSKWNGRLLEAGCGGACGTTDNLFECTGMLRRGYACIVSDSGHKGAVTDGLWARDNLQAQVDFGYRATHVTALAGKAITERLYDAAPERSYFWGCSTGGRQALVEAQRFPWDFDGIIAGAPWIDDTLSTMEVVWAIKALQGTDGKSILTHEDLQQIHSAALAQCDLDDGIRDGIIGNPRACRFDVKRLVCQSGQTGKCLTAAQAAAVNKMYSGPVNSKGEPTFVRGVMPGSELEWENTIIAATGSAPMASWATQYFRHMVMPALGTQWKLSDFDFDRDYKVVGATSESLLNAGNPDLRRFKAAGGKLLIYQGWNDPLGAIPERTIDYYDTVTRTVGGREATRDFARLFMIPGMGHCGADTAIDYLTYLETWVQKGQAPERVVYFHLKVDDLINKVRVIDQEGIRDTVRAWRERLSFPLDPTYVQFSRPVYAYPGVGRYGGRGDPNDPANFSVELREGPIQAY